MARPRIIRVGDKCEIHLKNCTPELADKIKALVDVETGGECAPAVQAAPVASPSGELPSTALGTFHKSPREWCLVTVKYNPITMEAHVESVKVVGESKYYAAENFRIQAARSGIV